MCAISKTSPLVILMATVLFVGTMSEEARAQDEPSHPAAAPAMEPREELQAAAAQAPAAPQTRRERRAQERESRNRAKEKRKALDTLFSQGMRRYRDGDIEGARESWSQMLETDPNRRVATQAGCHNLNLTFRPAQLM